jgi:hypothetical protein
MHEFLEVQHCHKEGSIPLPFMDEVLDKVANHEIGSFLDGILKVPSSQDSFGTPCQYKTTFIND